MLLRAVTGLRHRALRWFNTPSHASVFAIVLTSLATLMVVPQAAVAVDAGGAENVPILFQDNFESYPAPTLWDTLGAWEGHWYWDAVTDPDGSNNKVMRYQPVTIGGAGLDVKAGNLAWTDQALQFRFKWNGDHTPYYLFSSGIRTTAVGGYRLYATEHTDDGKMYFTLVRDGHTNYLNQTYGAGNWSTYSANIMDDSQLTGAAPTATISNKLAATLVPNQWYTVMLRAKGQHLNVFLDGKPIFGAVVDQFNINPAGRIGLNVAGNNMVVIDDVKVYDWSATPAITQFTNNIASNHEVEIVQGQTIQLAWSSVSAQSASLTANGAEIATTSTGSINQTPTNNTDYVLKAIGSVGTDVRVIKVKINPPASVSSFSASATAVVSGSDVTLSWAAANATQVTIDGIPGAFPTSGSTTVKPSATTTYTLRAVGPANTATSTVTVAAGQVTGLALSPEILPDLDTLAPGATLTLGAAQVISTGDRVAVSSPISWSSTPSNVITIDAQGKVTILDPAYQQPVAITATVNGVSHTRHLNLVTPPNLFGNSSLENGTNGWNTAVWQGPCAAKHSDAQAHTGTHSMQLSCEGEGRVGIFNSPAKHLAAGTYRLRAYLRGLSISDHGLYGQTTDVMVLNNNGGTFVNNTLLSGLFGWRPVEKVIKITSESDYYFYLRLFARGTLWVDDISLVRVADNEPEAVRVGAQLTPAPEICESDAPVCPLAAPTPVQNLTHYASGIAPFYATNASTQIVSAAEGQQLEMTTGSEGGSLHSWSHDGLPANWAGYDYLEFEIDNREQKFVDFNVEIRDDKTVDYWSRVNWYDQLSPGVNKLRIPLQIFVGERIQFTDQRRLDLANIRRLVLAFTGQGTFRVGSIRLTEEPFKCSRPQGLQAFDFGTNQSPVMHGFRAATGSMEYASCRGFGFVGNSIWRAEDRRSPDNLFRDWISFKEDASDDFVVDVANGEYTVKVFWEDAGYWEWYNNFKARSVSAEGAPRCAETMNYNQFLDNYYRREQHETPPNEETWETYIKPRFKASCTFDVTIADGKLNLGFAGDNPFAASVNGIVLYPKTNEAAAQVWLTQLDQVRKTNFNYDYRRLDAAVAIGDDDLTRVAGVTGNWLAFQREPTNPIYLNTVPKADERISELSASAMRGERVPLPFAVFPMVDLGQATALTIDGLPSGVSVESNFVLSLDQRLTSDGTVYGSRPTALDPVSLGAPLPQYRSRLFWPALTIGASTVPGDYAATVNIVTTSGITVTMPLNLRVLPLTLPNSPIRHSLQGTLPLYTGGMFEQELNNKRWAETPNILAQLEKYGMTALQGPATASWTSGGGCNTANAQRFADLLDGHSFAPVINTYANFGSASRADMELWHRAQDTATATNTLKCNNEFFRQRGYDLHWSMWDEPTDVGSLTNLLQQNNWYHNLAGAPGIESSGFASVHSINPDVRALQKQLFLNADLPFLTLFDEDAIAERKALNKPWGMYNNNTRFGYGLFGWMLNKQYGLSDITAFALNSVQSDPYYTLDSREGDIGYVFTTRSGRIRPTVDLEILSMGITDFRYMAALEQAISANPNAPATANAKQFVDATRAAITLANRNDQPTLAWYGAKRDQIVNHILAVKGLAAPTVTAGADQTIVEGNEVNIAASYVTAVGGDIVASVNWGDGSGVEHVAVSPNSNGGDLAAGHVYTDGSYIATITVCAGTACGTDTVAISVTDAAPTAGFVIPTVEIVEGRATQFVDASTSAVDALFGWMWSFGNQGSSLERNPSVTFDSQGDYNVCLTAVDSDGSLDTACRSVAVADTAPTAAFAVSPGVLLEGNTVAFTDASVQQLDTIVSWSWTFGNLGSSSEQNPSFAFADNGSYNVCLTATDSDGSNAQQCHDVIIADRAPAAGFSFGAGPHVEGDSVTFTDASVSQPDAIVSWQWNFGGAGVSAARNPTFTFTQDGTYNICLKVTDADGSASTGCHEIVIENAAPVISALTAPNKPTLLGQAITANVAFTDAAADSHSVRFHWGDDTTTDVWLAPGESSIGHAHTYAEPGVYTVRVSVLDDANAEAEASYEYVVIYDPAAGRVRGKGKYVSTAGSYVANANWTGITHFGLEARYKNNASVPTGNLQLSLKLTNKVKKTFNGTAFDWLVVNDDHAWLMGSASLDNSGQYAFLLTLIDGSQSTPIKPDRYRIKIWEKGSMTVVYDNEMGRDDTSNPLTIAEDGEVRVNIKD